VNAPRLNPSHTSWYLIYLTDLDYADDAVLYDGVTASGYGAENAWEVRAVRYSPVGDEKEIIWP